MPSNTDSDRAPSEETENRNHNIDENGNIDYKKSKDYWASQPATVDGMLGGFEYVSDVDIEQSQEFLNSFMKVNLLSFTSVFVLI